MFYFLRDSPKPLLITTTSYSTSLLDAYNLLHGCHKQEILIQSRVRRWLRKKTFRWVHWPKLAQIMRNVIDWNASFHFKNLVQTGMQLWHCERILWFAFGKRQPIAVSFWIAQTSDRLERVTTCDFWKPDRVYQLNILLMQIEFMQCGMWSA